MRTVKDTLKTGKKTDVYEELFRFEHFLSEISAKYINLPAGGIEEAIKRDLGRLVEFLGADRGVLYLTKGEDNRFVPGELPDLAYPYWPGEPLRLKIHEMREKDPASFDNKYFIERWSRGENVRYSHFDDLPDDARGVRKLYKEIGIKSFLSVPLSAGGAIVGALGVATVHSHREWPEELIPRIRLFAEVFGNALLRKRSEEKLGQALQEIKHLKDRIEADYKYLSEEINLEHGLSGIIGRSEGTKEVIRKIKQVAGTNAGVLLLGETGTGKGVFARAIHNAGMRKDRPLVQVNCAALTPSLIESELFGHEKGAFTGAQSRRLGRFEIADGSTLFLDEVGEIPLELQAKLLRVIQDGEFERVGGTETLKVDVRLITATNRDLENEVHAGRFRRDLWYRLSVFPIFIPPLKDRIDDIPLFVRHFLDKYEKWSGKRFNPVPAPIIRSLQGYAWPGNVRELENTIERAVIISEAPNLKIDIPVSGRGRTSISDRRPKEEKPMRLNDLEREHITGVLERVSWKITGMRGAAEVLGINPSTLRGRMKKLGIKRSNRSGYDEKG